MLICDKKELGDKLLNPEEGVAKLKEENLALAAKGKLTNQSELEDPERAAGPRLSYQEVIYRLTRCNPKLIFLDGSPGNMAVYAILPDEEGKPEKRYVGGFPKQPIPEYSYITTDEHGLPHREVRGWRTVLINMVKSGAITYKSAVKHFGEATGQRSTRWQEALRQYR